MSVRCDRFELPRGKLLTFDHFYLQVLVWPCLCAVWLEVKNEIKSVYWVVTEDELIIVTLRHFSCCSCRPTGEKVQTIPLEKITECVTYAQIKGGRIKNLPRIHLYSGGILQNNRRDEEGVLLKEPVASAHALHDQESLVRSLLNQRDTVKGKLWAAPAAQAMLVRGDDKPDKERNFDSETCTVVPESSHDTSCETFAPLAPCRVCSEN
jgi:hypothetical protein